MNTTSKLKTSYPDLSDRQNPQFKQTTHQYLIHKKQRKQLDKRKFLISNQVKHFKQLNQSLEKSLQQKQHQLSWLKQVRQRYLTSIQNKKNRQQEQKRKLQQLRIQNTHMRQKSIQNIHEALDQLHRKKSKAHNEVLRNLGGLKHRYSLKQSALDQANHSMYQQIRKQKVRGKNRVNKFFQKKNTQLTRFYKSMVNEQQQAFISGVKQIQQMHLRQSRFKNKITKKQVKMQKILNQIAQLKKSSHDIALETMRSSYGTVHRNQSKIRKVSRTQRTEQTGDQLKSIDFKLVNIGSKQFINKQQIH